MTASLETDDLVGLGKTYIPAKKNCNASFQSSLLRIWVSTRIKRVQNTNAENITCNARYPWAKCEAGGQLGSIEPMSAEESGLISRWEMSLMLDPKLALTLER